MAEEKVVVETVDGPVQYTFEAHGAPLPPPAVPKKKEKKHKKKHKKDKKKHKKWRTLRTLVAVSIALFVVTVATGIIIRYKRLPPQSVPVPREFNYSVYQRHGVNTTRYVTQKNIFVRFFLKSDSVPWTGQATTATVLGVLDGILRHTSHSVVCMHHIQDMLDPYRVCALYNRKAGQIYHMFNPRIIGESSELQRYKEESIACSGPTLHNRHKNVMLKWDIAKGNTMYGLFEDQEAVALQLSLDEFSGNTHCMEMEHNKTKMHTGTAMG